MQPDGTPARNRGMRILLSLSLVISPLLACGTGAGALPADSSGETVYRQPLHDGNTFACATCHALTDDEAPLRRAAHPIGGASKRGLWKNGAARSFLDAVNVCVEGWQGAKAWSAEEPRFIALTAFLDSQGDSASERRLTFRQVAPPTVLSGGDVTRGHALFNEACATCHGLDGVGSPRGPNLAGTQLAAEYVASRVRGFPLTGRMPFWSEDRLSDRELLDLIAWLGLPPPATDAGVVDAGTSAPDAGSSTPDAGTPQCGSSHPKVGWALELQTRAHGVQGRITATSDCTLQLTNFSYDGNGIDVRLYGAPSIAQLGAGSALGPQLYRPGNPWVNANLTVALPPGKTLDDVVALSVWCVAVGVSFGDGTLQPP